jgi:hypothetical protein
MVTLTEENSGKNVAAIILFLAAMLLLVTGSAGHSWAGTKGLSRSDNQDR